MDMRCRSREHEEDDSSWRLHNATTGAWRDWPNEAGFDGLTEEHGPVACEVQGTIPAWAAGSLFRTGPGECRVDDTPKGTYHISHWFDGLAHSHRFDMVPRTDGSGCQVHYTSRRQSEEVAARIRKHGAKIGYCFGQRADPCMGIFGKLVCAFRAAAASRRGWTAEENVAVTVQVDMPGLDKLPPKYAALDSSAAPSRAHRPTSLPGSVWLATDSAAMRRIDPLTLELVGFAHQDAFHPDLTGSMSCAHGQNDPMTGDYFNVNLDFGRFATYRIFRVSAATGQTDIMATISRPDVVAAYLHSFYLSPSFFILCLPSSHISLNGLGLLWERSVLETVKPFDPSNKCKWFVVDRHHGQGVVAEFETDAGFFFHTVNAYEERDAQNTKDGTVTVTCDVVDFCNFDILFSMYYDVLLQRAGAAEAFFLDPARAKASSPRLTRRSFRCPLPLPSSRPSPAVLLAAPTLEFSIPAPHAGELPTINPSLATKKHRYVYSVPSRGLSTFADTLAKTDTRTGECLFWANPKGHTPGEAVFVPRPSSNDEDTDIEEREDDGVLLSVVLDGYGGTSYLLCLDARDMREMGRAVVGFAVAFGFHGRHVGGEGGANIE